MKSEKWQRVEVRAVIVRERAIVIGEVAADLIAGR